MIKCFKCKNNSIYYNPTNQKEYCEKHFCEYFEKSIGDNISEIKIENPKIAVYYSGGKDSAALLYVLKKVMNYDIVAITADLGIVGYYNKVSELGKEICEKFDIEYYKVSLKDFLNTDIAEIVKEKNPMYACNYCGELRNIAMDLASRNLRVDAVASGHNRDDITRFLLNNYLKNDIFRITEFASKIYPSLEIKKEINYKNPIQLKPLIYLTEKEITLYCLIKKIDIIDSCCGVDNIRKSDMQNWRKDLTHVINYIEERYPGYSINIIKNFEKNIIPVFNQCALEKHDFFKKRQCVFCKEAMNSEEKDVYLICNNCSKSINLNVNQEAKAVLIRKKEQ